MENTSNLIGGMLNGFVGAKNQAQQANSMNEYRKAMTDHVKTQAKLEEQKINLAMMKTQGLPPELIAALNNSEVGGGPPIPVNQPNVPPVAQAPPPLPDYMAAGQMGGLGDMVAKAAAAKGEDPNFALAMMKYESGGNPQAVSPKGAQGLFQFMPGTGAGYGLNNPFDPQANTAAFLAHTADNRNALIAKGIEPTPANLAAAHNAGVSAVIKYGGVPPYKETQQFVQNVTGKLGTTTLGGGAASQPQPASIQRPATARGGGGIDSLPLGSRLQLDAYMKQNFDLDTKFRENKDKLHGDIKNGFVIERNGRPIAQIPGRGGMTMTDVQQPDGSVLRVPVAEPPPPQLPGIPVYTPGGGQGGLGSPAGMFNGAAGVQTKPPQYNYQEVKSPTGATSKVAVPQAQPGMSFQSEPPGVKIADAGRTNMIMQANNRMDEVNSMLFQGGKINRSLIGKATMPFGGVGEGSQLLSKMYQTVDSALRLETGAQANEQEIQTKMKEYWPSIKDTDATIKQKMKDLNEYVKGVVELNDPTGEMRKMRRATPANVQKQADPLGLR